MRSSRLNTLLLLLVAGSLASGCSVITSLDRWTFGDEDAGQPDGGGLNAGHMDAGLEGDSGPDCASGLIECSGECVDLDSSPQHCSACGSACPTPPNTGPLCSTGSCGWECAAGFADCNGEAADGCEIELASDPLNCGACDTAFFCREGTCRPMLPWVRAFGDTGATGRAELHGIAIDPAGNVYVTGTFAGTINVGGDVLESAAGSDDIFVASFTASGEHRWSRRGGGASDDHGGAIVFDGSDSAPKVHVMGSFRGSTRFDQEPSATDAETSDPLMSKGDSDIFIASFEAADGSHVGSRGWGGSSGDYASGIAVDSFGNIYVTGSFVGSNADFGGRILSSAGNYDIFVASYPPGYASTGSARWAKSFGSAGSDQGRAITVDSSGKVYVTGHFAGGVNFGTSPTSVLTSQGRLDVFVATFNSSGIHDWSISGGGSGDDVGRGIALDGESNVYIAGTFIGTASLGGGPQESAGVSDIFVASYDASGVHRWSSAAGGPYVDNGYAIATSGNGEVYSTGEFGISADFGDRTLTTSSAGAFAATNGAADGAHRDAFAIGGPDGGAHGWTIAAGDGLVCMGGTFSGSVQVGEQTLIAIRAADAFIACF